MNDILDEILQVVSEHTGITVEQIKSKTRKRNIAQARQLYYAAAREWQARPENPAINLQDIADTCGQTHSMALYAVEVCKNPYGGLKADYEKIIKKI